VKKHKNSTCGAKQTTDEFWQTKANDIVWTKDGINITTRNTFCGTWYLPHSQVHNDQTAPI